MVSVTLATDLLPFCIWLCLEPCNTWFQANRNTKLCFGLCYWSFYKDILEKKQLFLRFWFFSHHHLLYFISSSILYLNHSNTCNQDLIWQIFNKFFPFLKSAPFLPLLFNVCFLFTRDHNLILYLLLPVAFLCLQLFGSFLSHCNFSLTFLSNHNFALSCLHLVSCGSWEIRWP